MTTATVFYIDAQLLANHANPFGVRYDSSILPYGSCVVGFMTWTREKGVQELLDPTFFVSPNQEQSFSKVLDEARTVLLKG